MRIQRCRNSFRAKIRVAPVLDPLVIEVVGERPQVAEGLPSGFPVVVFVIPLQPSKAGSHDMRHDVVPDRILRETKKLVQPAAEPDPEAEGLFVDVDEELALLKVLVFVERQELQNRRFELDDAAERQARPLFQVDALIVPDPVYAVPLGIKGNRPWLGAEDHRREQRRIAEVVTIPAHPVSSVAGNMRSAIRRDW